MPKYFSFIKSTHGQSSFVIVIFVLVIIFAVMLSGGSASLFSGNLASPVTPTPTPSGTSASPSPTAAQSASWSLAVTLGTCIKSNVKSPYITGVVTAKGTVRGYLQLDIDNNGTKTISTSSFTPPQSTYPSFILTNDDGFNAHKWKLSIFSGGSQSGGQWTGGIYKNSYLGMPTNC